MQFFENLFNAEEVGRFNKAALNLPWYYNQATNDFTGMSNEENMVHNNIKESPYFVNLLGCEKHGNSHEDIRPFVPILQQLEKTTKRNFIDRIIRVKANFYVKDPNYPENHYHSPHIDMWDDKKDKADAGEIFLYYVNDSDGDTFFFNEPFKSKEYSIKKRATPKAGTGILFENSLVHASSSPRISEYRVNINFVFRA